jgi:methylated-DNA-[protein]-cysteine S-methyltransferase
MSSIWTVASSPIGNLLLSANDHGLTGLHMLNASDVAAGPGRRDDAHAFLAAARAELTAYFAGTLGSFTLPFAAAGTPFQQRVWAALTEIPYGSTTSYGALAARLGKARAVRAVGLANGRNPLPIIVPCHRVIGADGSLTGYGGGLERKRWLLAHEQAVKIRQHGRPP